MKCVALYLCKKKPKTYKHTLTHTNERTQTINFNFKENHDTNTLYIIEDNNNNEIDYKN